MTPHQKGGAVIEAVMPKKFNGADATLSIKYVPCPAPAAIIPNTERIKP